MTTYEMLNFELFGTELTIVQYTIIFFVCQLINVALSTIKTIVMHKEKKIPSTIINAIAYGFNAIIVVMTASDLPLFITVIVAIVTNLIGVYTSMTVLEKLKKASLWEIVATIKFDKDKISSFTKRLSDLDISFTMIDNWNKTETIFHIYSKDYKQSTKIKDLLDIYDAKYMVHEERAKLV